MVCTRHRFTPQIWIECPELVRAKFAIGTTFWDSGFLKIPVKNGRYNPVNRSEGSRYRGGILFVKRIARGFEVHAQVNELGVRAAVQYLAKQSECNETQRHTFNVIHDYIDPEFGDVEAAITNMTEPFTIRNGHIPFDEIKSSNVIRRRSSPVPILSNGFRFTFFEFHPR